MGHTRVCILASHTVSDALCSQSAQARWPPASPNFSVRITHACNRGRLFCGLWAPWHCPPPALLLWTRQLHCSRIPVSSPQHWSPQGHSVTDFHYLLKKNVCCTSRLLRTSPSPPQQHHWVNLTQPFPVLTMRLLHAEQTEDSVSESHRTVTTTEIVGHYTTLQYTTL